ncbi:MAG TPA: hypothetical protein VFQ06_04785, partial [Nitrospira sp.]|nr:hypothetical protein [Nitrospira sp.]
MFCKSRALGPRIRFASSVVLPLCLLLSACGGGGRSHVASIPPPPLTPPSGQTVTGIDVQTTWLASPATRTGTYDLIGRLTLTPGNGDPTSYRVAGPGEFSVTSSQPNVGGGFVYQLNATALLPGGLNVLSTGIPALSWDFNPGGPNFRYNNPYGDHPQYFGQNLKEYDVYSDGTKKLRESYDYSRGSATNTQSLGPDKNLQTTLEYDIGYSYVAMGEWSWRVVDLNGTAAGDFGDLLFVNGDRTPASGIPVSGTATYDARTLALLSSSGAPGIPFTLTADFSQRTMSTRIDQDYRYDPARSSTDDPILGIHVTGSAEFSNSGIFDIPLNGTANYA